MSESGRGLSIRALLTTMAVVGVLYGLALTFEIVVVLRPAASGLRSSAGALLLERNAIVARLEAMRASLKDLDVAFRQAHGDPSGLSPQRADALRQPIQQRLDSVVAMRASLQLAEIPAEMRRKLAEAVETETNAGLTMLDAVRALQAGEAERAGEALLQIDDALDATELRLTGAQEAAIHDLLARETGLLSEIRQVGRWALAWMALGALLFFFAVWLVRERLYQPLLALDAAVAQVAGGDLNAEAEVVREDELGLLARHFNAMAAVLRERADEETRRRENLTERFGRILDESSNEIYLFDADTLRFVRANRGARRNLGYSMQQLAELTPLDILRDISPESFTAALSILRGGAQPSLRLSAVQTRRDNTSYPVELTLQLAHEEGAPLVVAIVEDVSARSRMRELNERLRYFALHEQRLLSGGDLPAALAAITEMTASALGAARTSVWKCGVEGLRCLDAYRLATREHGGGEALLAAEHRAYFAALQEGDQLAVSDARQDARTCSLAVSGCRPELRAQLDTPVRAAGRVVAIVTQEAAEPRAWSAEEQAFTASVADLVALAMEAAERRSLQNQLAESQKMESVGRLAGGVAHDFNNLLTAILGYSEFAKSTVSPHDPLYAELAEVEKAALRAAALTRQLLTFARRQVVQPVVLDVSALTQGADKLLRRLIGEDVELVTLLEPELKPVRIDPGQLEQVIVNLAVNARDAMPSGGRLTLTSRNLELDLQTAASFGLHGPGTFVELTVADTGHGMDATTLRRVFEPFFTTKEAGRGTGLGLATCYGIVRQAGGGIAISSAPGRGTTVRVLLPKVDEACQDVVIADQAPPAARGRETLLLVEDEGQIRQLAARGLRSHGYTVLTAINGEEGMRLAREHLPELDLVVTDVVLPLLGGAELIARLRHDQPNLPVIYISGYTGGEVTANELAQGNNTEFMAKPFTPRELARRVRELLDRTARSG